MARIKIKNSITSLAAAEEAMYQLDAVDRQFARWDLAEAEAVQKVRERFNEKRKAGNCAGLEAEKALLVRELEAWAETASVEWKKKTISTSYGRLGFRTTPPTVTLIKKVAKSFKKALVLLKGYGRDYYVRYEPKIDREAILADWRDKALCVESLNECGLTVDQTDEFWIETTASKDLEEAIKKLKCA